MKYIMCKHSAQACLTSSALQSPLFRHTCSLSGLRTFRHPVSAGISDYHVFLPADEFPEGRHMLFWPFFVPPSLLPFLAKLRPIIVKVWGTYYALYK